jgi:hypothetical protein
MENLMQLPLGRPTPITQLGNIVAQTDFFLLRRPGKARHLIMHSLPAAGGASGSPIVNRMGEVVAVYNAANVHIADFDDRIPSAVDINFGQRADLVRELLDGTAEALTESRRAEREEDFSLFVSGEKYRETMLVEFKE